MNMNDSELMTPVNLARAFNSGLTSSEIGYCYYTGAVLGIKPAGCRTSLIYKKSFERFIEYKNEVEKSDCEGLDLMTPVNLAREFDSGLTSHQIGYLFLIGAVKGLRPRGSRTSLIYKKSFEKYLEYRKSIFTFVT
tara:strand:- start:265 stop:672 length:408 start_codon:yes stop_codon:yes gene_type:complete